VWTLSEFGENGVKAVSRELLAWGRYLADKLRVELSSVIIGNGIAEKDVRELTDRGADRVYVVNDPALSRFVVENYSAVLTRLIRDHGPEVFIASATTMGRTLMPHVAVKVETGITADCTGLDIEEGTGFLLQTRPAIGGNVLAEIKTPRHRPQMATVRPKTAPPAAPPAAPLATPAVGKRGETGDRGRGIDADKAFRKADAVHVDFDPRWVDRRVERIGLRKTGESDIDIQGADVVVSGGGGLKKAENFAMIRALAERLGGAVGASRQAVDRGWVPYPRQVGLSGKTVTPKLYVAVCISGSIQHLAGMKTAETIVAVNSDPDAPIFRFADFGVVGDAFEIVPLLVDRLEKRESSRPRRPRTNDRGNDRCDTER
jgi:electron transfer flavoprotein alpha subunit